MTVTFLGESITPRLPSKYLSVRQYNIINSHCLRFRKLEFRLRIMLTVICLEPLKHPRYVSAVCDVMSFKYFVSIYNVF